MPWAILDRSQIFLQPGEAIREEGDERLPSNRVGGLVHQAIELLVSRFHLFKRILRQPPFSFIFKVELEVVLLRQRVPTFDSEDTKAPNAGEDVWDVGLFEVLQDRRPLVQLRVIEGEHGIAAPIFVLRF